MNCLSIINKALRRIGVLAPGQIATDAELDDALNTLKDILYRIIGEGTLAEIAYAETSGETFEATVNTHVLRDSLDTTTIDLPDRPEDGSVIKIANTLTNSEMTYVFDADLSTWIALETLGLTSKPPLAKRDPIGLSCYLASELADEYGQPVSEMVALNAARFHRTLMDGARETAPIPRPENYF